MIALWLHQLSLHNINEFVTPGPIDLTPGSPVSDKNIATPILVLILWSARTLVKPPDKIVLSSWHCGSSCLVFIWPFPVLSYLLVPRQRKRKAWGGLPCDNIGARASDRGLELLWRVIVNIFILIEGSQPRLNFLLKFWWRNTWEATFAITRPLLANSSTGRF